MSALARTTFLLAFFTGAASSAAAPNVRMPEFQWTHGPDMPQAEAYATASSVGGRFYVFGGQTARATQMFDPATSAWTQLAPPPVNVAMANATAVGRVIYVYGGCVNSDCSFLSDENWAYDTATGVWTKKAPMPLARQGMSAGVIDGKIFVAGGFLSRYVPSAALTVYDPVSDVWTTRASMPAVRANGGAAALDGKLYYAGGTSNSWGQEVEPRAEVMVYDPATNRWSPRAPLPRPALFPGVAVIASHLFVAGGVAASHGSAAASTWIYESPKDSWIPGPSMTQAREATIFAAGKDTLFAAGGFPANSSFEFATATGGSIPRKRTGDSDAVTTETTRSRTPHSAAEADVDRPAFQLAERPEDYALVIGIEKYSRVPDAPFAQRDAEAMKANLLALGYPERNIILLTGANATRGALQGYIEEWLPKNTHPDSQVFVYFSGHGSPDPKSGEAYLVPWDGDAMFLKSTAYPLESLYASLGKLRISHVVVALDSCFSGAGGRSILVAGARPLVSHHESPDVPTGITVLTAASGDEITGTLDERGHGTFTYYLLQALAYQKLTVKNAFLKLKPRVQDEAHRQNREQTPQMFGVDSRF